MAATKKRERITPKKARAGTKVKGMTTVLAVSTLAAVLLLGVVFGVFLR